MNKASKNSMVLMEAGLVNNPRICIKNYGSTFACVCESCTHEFRDRLSSYFS